MNRLQLALHKNTGNTPLSSEKKRQRQALAEEPSANQARGKRLIAEGALIGWIALCSILLLALLSYSANDPGWSHTGPRVGIDNAVGLVGAWCADVFFSLFGVMAYLFPALLAVRALQILRNYIQCNLDVFVSYT